MALLQQHEVAGAQVPHRDLLRARQRIVGARDEPELVLEQPPHGELAGVIRQRDQSEIQIGRAQALEQALGEVLAQVQLELRVLRAQLRQDHRQQERCDGGNHAQAQRPGQRLPGTSGCLDQVMRLRQQGTGPRDHLRAGGVVMRTERDPRSTRDTSSRLSSSLMPAERVDWVTWQSAAA